MKKFRIFIAILVTILIACCFISAKPKSFLSSANAQATPTTSNVTFYGDDRTTPLLNIPNWQNGSTIYDFNCANLIKNGSFDNVDINTLVYGNNSIGGGWFIQLNSVAGGPSYELGYNGFTFYNNGRNFFNYIRTSNFFFISDTYYYFLVELNGVIYSGYMTPKDSLPDTYGVFSTVVDKVLPSGLFLRFEHFNNNTTTFAFNIGSSIGLDFSVSFCYVGLEPITSYYDYYYLKKQFLNNKVDFENINDYDLLFTNNYYQYTQYFNASYIVKNDTNFYITYKEKNLTYLPTQDFTITNGTNTFSNTGQNLLNNINQDAISFEVLNLNTLNFDSINYTSSYTLNKLIADYELNISNYSTYIDNYGNEFYFRTFVTQQNTNYLYQNELYDYNIKNSLNFVYPLFDFSKNLIQVGNTYKIFGDAQVINFTKYSSFSIEYKINYNMQFYYADYFGIGFDIGGVLFETQNDTITLSLTDRQNRNYFYTSNLEKPKQIVLTSPYLKNSLIDTFRLDFNTSNLLTFPFDENNFASIQDAQAYFNNMSINIGFDAQKLYFFNPETNTNSSAIIPTTSDGLYKEKEYWYDFTTDLYNFVIYICFDAPFISNITQLLYVIISLIKKLFDLIIALFTTSNSTIFIAIFFGFFLLKIILNKFIGGKE